MVLGWLFPLKEERIILEKESKKRAGIVRSQELVLGSSLGIDVSRLLKQWFVNRPKLLLINVCR